MYQKMRQDLIRKLAVSIIFIFTNIIIWHKKDKKNAQNQNQNDGWLSDLIDIRLAGQFTSLLPDEELTSGVGLVTTDGMWGELTEDNEKYNKYKDEDIKILGFTDRKYISIAKHWYTRLSLLGYKEHYIVAHDEDTYNNLMSNDMRALPCFITDPDYAQPIKGLWQQIMAARLHFTMELLKNGTHVLITDVDNVYSRYVPMWGFLEEGYDVYHAYEMMYPLDQYNQFGFVVCSGHQFLRATPETIKFMDLVNKRCPFGKCDDQVTYNRVFHLDLDIQWDNDQNPNHPGAIRINTTHVENTGLLVESATGRSKVTNHTIKIWDRDFAWRLAGSSNEPGLHGAIPDFCPSANNWLGMPTKLDHLTGAGNRIQNKIAAFEIWDKMCRSKHFSIYS